MRNQLKFALKSIPAALGLLMALHGGAADAMDVADAYRLALANDPASLAADSALAAGNEAEVQGDALLRPRIGLQAGVTRIHNRQTGELGPAAPQLIEPRSSGTAQQATVQLLQPIYDQTIVAGRRQLREQSTLARIRFAASRQDLALRVAEAYFAVLVAEDTVRVVQAEQEAVQHQRDRAQARFAVGHDRITDVQEAQARLDAVGTRLVSALSVASLRQAQFREITGTAPDGLAPMAASFVPRLPEPSALAEWQARGEQASTQVLAKESERQIASAELGKHKLASRPTLDLVASYGAKHQHGSLSALVAPDGDRTSLVGLVLNVPLYAGGALDSRQREAAARYSQVEQELAAARRDVRLKVQEGYLAVTTGVARIAAQEQALVSARSALDATMRGRDVGTRTALDVLDAEQRLYAAELDLVQGRADYLLGRLRLAAAAGELNEDTLRSLHPWLAH